MILEEVYGYHGNAYDVINRTVQQELYDDDHTF